MCGRACFFAGSGAALNGASACDRVRDIVAERDLAGSRSSASRRHVYPDEPPKMREGNDFMSQRPIDIANSGFRRFPDKE